MIKPAIFLSSLTGKKPALEQMRALAVKDSSIYSLKLTTMETNEKLISINFGNKEIPALMLQEGKIASKVYVPQKYSDLEFYILSKCIKSKNI